MPYAVPQGGEQDRYPLMGNFTKLQATLDAQNYAIEFDSDAAADDVALNQTGKDLTFNVDNPNKTESFCRIAIPKDLMWSNTSSLWTVTINGNLAQKGAAEDGNWTYIYFTFSTGSYTIKITATNMAPENFFLHYFFFLWLSVLHLHWPYPSEELTKLLDP